MKIRVLEVLATLKRAGAERVAVSLAEGLDAKRFETAVVTLYDAFPGGFDAQLEARAVPVWRLGKRPGFDPRMWPRLARVLGRFRPSIVHTHSYVLRYALPAALWARAGAMVHTVHNLAPKEVDAAGRLLHRLAFRRRVAAVAVSDEVARSFRAFYGRKPAAVIPNGIEVRPASEGRAAWRRDNGFVEDDLLVLSVARLDEQKNPLGLIDAFARALGGDPRAYLLLAGDGALRGEALRRAELRGAGAQVRFLGVRDDVPAMLAAADLFALASHWEGRPMAVMEALAAGLPVAATAAGGVPGLVEHGVTGLLAPPGDLDALAGTLAELACDPGRRREMGASALRRAADFGVDAMVASYAALFERLAGGAA